MKSNKYWMSLVKDYAQPDDEVATGQLIFNFTMIILLLVASHVLYHFFGFDWNIIINIFTGFFLSRVFIIQHDCGHGSFTDSKSKNDQIGKILSFFTHIPYEAWSKLHSFHHAHTGQHEASGLGDMPTCTVLEYEALNVWKKFSYRVLRNPISLFIIGPLVYFYRNQRVSVEKKDKFKDLVNGDKKYNSFIKNTSSYMPLNLVLVAYYLFLFALTGDLSLIISQVIIVWSFGMMAMWFFYVQHQFEDVYKKSNTDDWSYVEAAIKGSSYYKLPRFFRWLSGNIGYHHIHHLNHKVPNYKLRECHEANKGKFESEVTVLTIKKSLESLSLALYDEKKNKMISFKTYQKTRAL